MKIRHKQSGVELEGEFIECGEGGPGIPSRSYFSDIHSGSLYDKVCWEAVPEWVDVTGGCEWDGNMYLNDRARPLSPIVCDGNLYRLRKVGVEWFSGAPLGLPKWAFIVERKA